MAEELSQEDIDSLFSSSDEPEEKSMLDKFSSLLSVSFEEVLRTALNLDVVVKLIDVGRSSGEDESLEDGVVVRGVVSTEDKSAQLLFHIRTRFATILSDLMLMGPGNPKDEIEDEDLDALKELFSQIFGNLSTALKDNFGVPFSVTAESVEKGFKPPEGDLYRIKLDVAIPNVDTDTVTMLSGVNDFDSVFAIPEPTVKDEEIQEEQERKTEREAESHNVFEQQSAGSVDVENVRNLDLILDIDLDVEIRIGQKEMLIRDLLKVNEGSIIELDRSIEEPLEVVVNGKVIARGIVVVVGGHFGIKITSIETREERVKSLGES